MKLVKLFCLFLVLIFSSAKGQEKQTKSLHQAAVDGNIEQVKSLLSGGADVNAQNDYGQTPLHCAVIKGHTNIVEVLIAEGADIEAKDNAWRTPLHYAAGAGSQWRFGKDRPYLAELLLDKGADINASDKKGWTPLHYATGTCCEATIELLVDRGAELSAADERGRTAFTLAQRMSSLRRRTYGQTEIAKRYRKIAGFLSKDGRVYCVATNGRDWDPGTMQRPFGTLSTAISVAEPGDTILVRGGAHSYLSTIHIDKSGKQDRRIHLEAYPGERPVLDFSKAQNEGFIITGAYWHLKELNITGAEHWGIKLETKGAHHNVLEQIAAHANGVTGVALLNGAANNLVLNCDSYQNFDLETSGENADGFEAKINLGKGNTFIGCRAWNNSDDGFDFWDAGSSVRVENCYAYRNGENIWNHPCFTGNANGFKLGQMEGAHLLIRCVAWDHPWRGFDLNGNSTGITLYNCTAFRNNINFAFTFSKGNIEKNILRSNLSYKGLIRIRPEVDDRFNSWNLPPGTEISEQNFVSLDDSTFTGPRNPDGSIPDSDFLRLAPRSTAIDKGVDVNMPYTGKSPDLGAFEYNPAAEDQSYVKMLHQVVRDHDLEKIRKMLTEGTDVNEKDWLGYTALHWAIYFGYSDVAEILIAEGSNPNIKSDTGRTPMEIAIDMDYNHLTEILRKHGAKE